MNASIIKKILLATVIVGLSVISVYCFWQFIKSAGMSSYPGVSAQALHDINAYAYKNLGVSMASLVTVLLLAILNRH